MTPEGETFRIKAAAAMASFTEAVERPFGGARPLRVGHAWSAFGDHTSAVLRRWRTLRPEQPLELCRLDDPYAGMAGGWIDISVLRGPQPRPGYRSELLYSEERVAAVSVEHRLARRHELRLVELAGEGLIVHRNGGTTTPELWNAEARPSVAAEVGSVDDWQSNIAANNGVGITPASSTRLRPHAEIVYIPLTDAPSVPVFLAWAPNSRHPALSDFSRVAHAVVHGAPEGLTAHHRRRHRLPLARAPQADLRRGHGLVTPQLRSRASRGAGSRSHGVTPYARPDNWLGERAIAIRPALVVECIRRAVEQGWNSGQPGTGFALTVTKDELATVLGEPPQHPIRASPFFGT
ncbi:LysR family substrate-binding domain-containing protein [Nonomuraea sp. NPDC047529]|uniref:LysR family substrate-binding domain-containing protein n=1 Tax=Nonomuraea sp. NPDC047529 TaxID=3155623 RepID=UPI0033DE77A4